MHHIIELFARRATVLEQEGSEKGLDDAIAELALWMDVTALRLSETDVVALGEIGGVLYREGLRRREGA